MSFLRRFPLLAYTLVFLSLLGFTYAARSYGLLAFSVAAVLVSWWLVETGDGLTLPRWVINLGVLVAAMILFWELVLEHQSNYLLGLGHFMVGLIICKLFEKKGNRDYGQILLLSLLLILSGSILTISPIYALILLIYLALALYTSLVFHLQCETQRAVERHAAGDRLMIMPGQQASMARDMRRISVGAGLFLFVFACGLFILFPRTGMPGILAEWQIHGVAQTGLTNRIHLGGVGQLRQSNAIVAEVTLTEHGRNIGSTQYQPYFMSTTQDLYDSDYHEWINARHPTDRFPDDRLLSVDSTARTRLVPRAAYGGAALITQRYTFNDGHAGPLLAICPAVTIRSADLRHVGRFRDGTIVAPRVAGYLSYTVQSPVKYDAALVGPEHPQLFPVRQLRARLSYFTPLDDSPVTEIRSAPIPARIVALARKIAGPLLKSNATGLRTAKTDMLLAERFNNYLRMNYPYSLDMTPVNPNIDPTEDFLFNKRKIGGYCEYFASAMVMLCRGVHIAARTVSGFHGGDYNPIGGYYVIREKFAHAWVQVYIPHKGWVLFDPSPSSSLTSVQRRMTWHTQVADFFQWLRLKWVHNIVTFNQVMRKAILSRIEVFGEGVMQTLTHFFRAVAARASGFFKSSVFNPWIRIAMGLVAAGMMFLGFTIYKWWMRRGSIAVQAVKALTGKAQRRRRRELAFIDTLMRLLQRTGITRQPDQSPREYVQVVAGQTRLDLGEALRLVGVFYDIRFGTQRMSPDIAGAVERDIAATAQKLRRGDHAA